MLCPTHVSLSCNILSIQFLKIWTVGFCKEYLMPVLANIQENRYNLDADRLFRTHALEDSV